MKDFDLSWNDNIDNNNNKCIDGEKDTFVMVSNGGKNAKVGNDDCINLEIGEAWLDYLEIGQDLLRIECVEESKSTSLGSKAPNAIQMFSV